MSFQDNFHLHQQLIILQKQTIFLQQYKCQFLINHTPDILPQLWDMLYLFNSNLKNLYNLNKLFCNVSNINEHNKFHQLNWFTILMLQVIVILLIIII